MARGWVDRLKGKAGAPGERLSVEELQDEIEDLRLAELVSERRQVAESDLLSIEELRVEVRHDQPSGEERRHKSRD